MKRGLIYAVALVVFALTSATALAATQSYNGHLKSGGKVKLRVEIKRGDPVAILPPKGTFAKPGYNFAQTVARCDKGVEVLTPEIGLVTPDDPLEVSAKGTFKFAYKRPPADPQGSLKIKVAGRFDEGNKRVDGTFRWAASDHFTPDFEDAENCDTGTVRWTARR